MCRDVVATSFMRTLSCVLEITPGISRCDRSITNLGSGCVANLSDARFPIFTNRQRLSLSLRAVISGGEALVSRLVAQLMAAAAVVIAFVVPAGATGALAVGKCGAYGQAFDFKDARAAMSAAQQQCRG